MVTGFLAFRERYKMDDNDTSTGTETDTSTGTETEAVVDHSACEAKVTELTDALAAATVAHAEDVARLEAALTAAKAANWDLAQQIPASDANVTSVGDSTQGNDEDADRGESIMPEDLFNTTNKDKD
jgi:hypothetical protein